MSDPAIEKGSPFVPGERDTLAGLLAIAVGQAVAVLSHLGVADVLIEGPCRVDDIAAAVGAHSGTLYRLLRFVAARGVFTEVQDRVFALTPMAQWLRSDAPGGLRWKVTGDVHVKPWYPWEEWITTVETGEPAYQRMHGESFWQAMARDAEASAVFDADQERFAARVAPAVLDAVDVAAARVLVDVGGGTGVWAKAIVERYPDLRVVLFDRPNVINQVEVPPRVATVAGDFFTSVPAGGDVYFLASVLHDWDDDRAAAILRRCHDAMNHAGRLVVVERVVPPGDTPDPSKDVDLNMLFLVGGRERSAAEFSDLFAAGGFELVSTISTQCEMFVIEARPDG